MAVCNVVILAVLLFFFLGGRDFSLEQKEDARLIGVSYMTMNNEFYTIISEEVAYRVEAEGSRYRWNGQAGHGKAPRAGA